jgi:hypothetical protein
MFRAIEPLIGETQKRVEGLSITPKLRRPMLMAVLRAKRSSWFK